MLAATVALAALAGAGRSAWLALPGLSVCGDSRFGKGKCELCRFCLTEEFGSCKLDVATGVATASTDSESGGGFVFGAGSVVSNWVWRGL